MLLAHAELRDPAGAAFSLASILRAAMAFGTNKENFHAETGQAEEGYPTREHRKGIAKFGLSPFHRKTFSCLTDEELTLF